MFAGSAIWFPAAGNERCDSLGNGRIRQIYISGPLWTKSHALDDPLMAAGNRNVRIHLSQQCFDLLADAMCAYSKRTGRFQTMRMTVQRACERLQSHGISKEELDLFLSEFPVDGDITVWLEVSPKWSADYDALRDKVKKIGDRQGIDKILVPLAVYLAERHNLI
ncbi:hypothetical protein [Novosphingobium aerophilum]|nr:hypothetical protein [Novosphingobium aerophilum]